MNLLNFSKNLIQKAENNQAPFYHLIFVFFFSILVRNFLEVLVYQEISLSNIYSQLHYSTYYIALVAWIIWLSSVITKTPVLLTAKVVLTFIPVIITCPIVDFGFHQISGTHQTLGYLSPELHGGWFSHYFTFFGSHFTERMGPTIGYRIEVLLVLIGFGFYYFVKQKSAIKTAFSILLLYTLIYWFCTTPYLLKSILPWKYSDHLVPYYLVLSLVASMLIFAKHSPKLFKLWTSDLRAPRMLYFVFLLIFGTIYSLKLGGMVYGPKLYVILFSIIALAFAWVFSVMTNNLADINIDKISNPKRPVAQLNATELNEYKALSWLVLAISLIFAWYADFVVLYFIAIFIFNYFVYSMPPIRFKRVPVFSKLPIALNSFLVFLLGAVLAQYKISDLPLPFALFFIVGGTLAINFIDLKDFEGDKAEGIKTLPVLIGLRPAKLLLALIFLAGYVLSYIFTLKPESYFFLLAIGFLQFINLTSKNYRDWVVVVLFLVSITVVIVERVW